MRKKYLSVATFLILVLLVTFFSQGCAPQVAQPISGEVVTDDLGREVCLASIPQKIISLAPSNTEILFALGLGNRVIGVTEFCNYPPEIETLKLKGQLQIIGGFTNPDFEKIIALNPDLILATKIHEKEVIPKLQSRGFTVFALHAENIEETLVDIDKVGQITGATEQAGELINQMGEKITALEYLVRDLPEVRVLFVTWHEPLYTAGSGTIPHNLIDRAGGNNIFQDLTGHITVDLEAIINRNPQIILAASGHGSAYDKPYTWAKEEPRLAYTAARLNNRVYLIDTDTVSRSGPRLVAALEALTRLIHPEVFND